MTRGPATPIPWLYQGLWQAQDQGGQAYALSVYKNAPCPCGNTPDSPSKITCAACAGTGLLYPMPSRTVLGIVSDVTLHQELLMQGLAQPGDLQVSTQPGQLHLDPFDLCLIPWTVGVPVTGDVLVRGTGTTDQLPYRAVLVEGVWTVNPTTGQITTYTAGQDFTVQGKVITWIGRQPAAGAQYTIRFNGDFEWIVFDPPDQRVAFGQDLGQRAILRKRYLVLPDAPSLLEG